jgi:hypothetical protein
LPLAHIAHSQILKVTTQSMSRAYPSISRFFAGNAAVQEAKTNNRYISSRNRDASVKSQGIRRRDPNHEIAEQRKTALKAVRF